MIKCHHQRKRARERGEQFGMREGEGVGGGVPAFNGITWEGMGEQFRSHPCLSSFVKDECDNQSDNVIFRSIGVVLISVVREKH